MKQKRIRAPKRGTPSATTQKIIDHLLRLADPDRRDDPEVETTMLVMMRVQRRTVREVRGREAVSAAVHSHGELTPSEISTYYAARMPRLKQRGREWRGPCPIHDGKDDNFAVNAENGTWYCHSACGRGGSTYDLEMALTNADFRTAAHEVRQILGRPDLQPVESGPQMKWGLPGWQHEYLRQRIAKVESEQSWKHGATYPYFHADGCLSYVKVRFIDKQNDKTFRQYALSSKGGWVSRKKAGKAPILYRLNTLATADEIFLVNGEKAADRGAAELGIVTTCAPDGEGKWCGEYTRPLVRQVGPYHC